MRIVCIEGGIGAGKTSVLKVLEARGFFVSYEPTHLWTESGLLGDFYDGRLSAVAFQLTAMSTRFCQLKKDIDAAREAGSDVLFAERSLDADALVFARQVCTSQVELSAVDLARSTFMGLFSDDFEHIMLVCTVDTQHARICLRNRDEEGQISRLYLEELEGRHREFSKAVRRSGRPVSFVCCEASAEDTTKAVLDVIEPSSVLSSFSAMRV